MKNWPFFRKFWFFWGIFELCTGLVFVGYPALVVEYLYPHYAFLGVGLSIIQIGWIHVGVGFWNTYLLCNPKIQSTTLASLGLIWSVSIFKELWSLWWIVSWHTGWGGIWHIIHIILCIGIWIQIKGYHISSC